jgi:ATP-binding cassette subfamily A (ABC1) protein 12
VNNIDIIDQLNTLSSLTVNISSCVLYDRIQASDTVEEMETVAEQLYKSNELFGSKCCPVRGNKLNSPLHFHSELKKVV